MLNYRIEKKGTGHPVPVVIFEDSRYSLISEFLLAEARSLGTEILSFLESCRKDSPATEFSGNVFRIEAAADGLQIINDITDKSCRISPDDLIPILQEYLQQS